MRERRQTQILSVMAFTFGALLLLPLAASAASGLPATITMQPASAGPGAIVEIVGLDFPASQAVQLQLTTTAGPVPLDAATTEAGGYFRHKVRLPADIAPGFWELRATGSDGSVAVHIFESGATVPASAAVAPVEVSALSVSSSGGASGANLLVLVVFMLLVGSIGGAAAFVYYRLNHVDEDPGMGAGDDPIWGGAPIDI